MKITNIKCPNCGANLNIEENKKYLKCQYCNANLAIEKDLNDELNAIILNNTKIVSKVFPIIFITVFVIIIVSFITMFSFSNKLFKNSKSDFNVKSFNNAFTYSNGNQSGLFVNSTLDEVIDSNKRNKDHQIYIKYQDNKTNKENEIIKIKDKMGIYTNYEVSIDYDDDGYVNLITINEK